MIPHFQHLAVLDCLQRGRAAPVLLLGLQPGPLQAGGRQSQQLALLLIPAVHQASVSMGCTANNGTLQRRLNKIWRALRRAGWQQMIRGASGYA